MRGVSVLSLKLLCLMKDFSQEMSSISSCPPGFLKNHLPSFNLTSETGRMQDVNEDYWQLYRVWNHFVSAEVLLEVRFVGEFVGLFGVRCRKIPA